MNDAYRKRKNKKAKKRDRARRKTQEWKSNAAGAKKVLAEERLKTGCLRCSLHSEWKYNESVLEFHHKDPSKKLFGINNGIRSTGISKTKFIRELDKCDVLCANHHKLIDSIRGSGYGKSLA